jgi:TolB protein
MVFTSFLRGTPALFVLTPQEGHLRMLWDRGGVNSSASFSPDGSRVAFASSEDGNTDIYEVEVDGGTPRRLTSARGIDTQPAWAPNGRQIAFTSTRSGSPQIYLMDADGSNVRRLSFDGSFFDEATWSGEGTRLACTTKVGNRFQIATIDTVTGEQRVIPGPGNNESPCFSPDGSMLAFSSDRTGTPQIFITDADGVPRQLTREGENHSPTWTAATP